MRNDFDWFSLMRGITEMHVKSLKDSAMEVAGSIPARPLRGGSSVGERHGECEGAGGIWPSPRSLPGSVSGNEGVGGVPDFRQREQVAPSVSDRCVADSQAYDVANQGRGIAPSTESITVGIGGGVTVISSPLYLLASEIVDLVELERKNR